MCGICGIFSTRVDFDKVSVIHKMQKALAHRGPDSQGSFASGKMSVAMTRLAVIDPLKGRQPFLNENKSMAAVCNGEIYNYQELRADLIQRGHQFKSNSDSEVVVHLYEEYKTQTPSYLKGMFAFCVLDFKEQTMFLARDRFGEKPLYYCALPEGLFFSSEIKSLMEVPFIPRRINMEALGYYLRVGVVPAPQTMFRDVSIIPPGSWMYYQNGKTTVGTYYRINFETDNQFHTDSVAEEAVAEALQKAVARQMMSDVPLGAFLSGGVDSSTIAAYAQQNSPQSLKTFTVKFEEKSYDESLIAKKVSHHLGTQHQEIFVPNHSFEESDLWRIIDHIGVPFHDSSAIPTFLLSRNVAKHVKVALSGDGGDELFAGYSFFKKALLVRAASRLPKAIVRQSLKMVILLEKLNAAPQLRVMKRGLDAALRNEENLPFIITSLFDDIEILALFNNPKNLIAHESGYSKLASFPEEAKSWSFLRQCMYYRLKHQLPGDMLTKIDSMSMACSLEVRAPFLDVDLASLAMKLPDRQLIRAGKTKDILRRIMKPKLPKAVFAHPKQGFSIPLHRFKNASYKGLAQELILKNPEMTHLFYTQFLEQVVNLGLSQIKDTSVFSVYRVTHQLWMLLQLGAWIKRFNVKI